MIVVSLPMLNCGLEKMVLSQLRDGSSRDGSFIFVIVIFPEMLEGSLFMQVVLLLLQKQEFLISFKPSVGGPQKLSKFIFIIILPSLLSYFAIIWHYAYHHPFLGSLLLVSNMHFFLSFLLPHFHPPSLPSSSLLAIMHNAMSGGTTSSWGLPLFPANMKGFPFAPSRRLVGV